MNYPFIAYDKTLILNRLLKMEGPQFTIRAKRPDSYSYEKHRVTKFKRQNYDNFYTPDSDGYYTYKGESADYHYSEEALLSRSDMEVVEYVVK